MKRTAILVFVFAFGIFLAEGVFASAQARCLTQEFYFSVGINRGADPISTITGGNCEYFFMAGGRSTFTNASVTKKAGHGRFEQIGRFRFRYTPSRGYKGEDHYAMKICGRNLMGKGCSVISFKAIVK
ncbi:hypothetical protein C8N35_11064 [Breoghania corrubedonensis]|uniref:Uncharacterized protein n=1 Tax=Breoghania corrubedonensis TaxID=665038 RepID=A0A2T5V1F0_9HYPH|nr:hypothetical protein [Breoghania corrubedonensis]PTW57585.1 hypothetical protein C8N35_11064 [Breoghania corrubedonensis]